MNFNFGEILTRAWQITWKYKVLWIFGILAGFTQGSGGGSGGGSNSGYRAGPSDQNLPPELKQFFHQMQDFVSWVEANLFLFIAIGVLVFLLFMVLFTFLGTIGRVGLIKGTHEAELGAENLVFGELFRASLPYFWRVFGLSFLIGLAFFLILMPLVLLGVLTAGVAFLCILPLICILVPIGAVVGVIIEQANRAIVLEDVSMFDGLKRGWEIVRTNVGPTLIMGIILFVMQFIIGIIIALPVILIVFPTAFAFMLGESQSFTPLYIALACICLYAPVSWVLNGVLITYTQSAWTLTYMRLTQKSEPSEAPVLAEPNA